MPGVMLLPGSKSLLFSAESEEYEDEEEKACGLGFNIQLN